MTTNPPAEQLRYQQVLLVDDEIATQTFVEQQLRQLGVQNVTAVTSGAEAITWIKSHQPDLIVCDLRLQDMDGLKLLREFSEQQVAADLLLVSGADERVLSTVQQIGEALGFTMLGALAKPLRPDELRWALRERDVPTSIRMQAQAATVSSKALLAGLRGNALEAFYQPKICSRENRIIGFEALARWRREDGNLIAPFGFIPQAEKFGLIDELTMRLLRTVLADMRSLDEVTPDLMMAVNFSVDTLQNRQLPDMLLKLVESFGIAPQRLIIEVTESRLSSEHIHLLEVLARLHLHGFQLSIDDFGTGYSSLYRVKDIPFSELKIDRSFVSDALDSSSARAVIRSSLKLAQDLQMKVTAEGVETEQIRVLMEEMGCEVLQGYWFGRPQSLADNIATLKATPVGTDSVTLERGFSV